MFNPIENGTIFDMALAVILGFILGYCINVLYWRLQLELGLDPTEKGGWKELGRHFAAQVKEYVKANFRR